MTSTPLPIAEALFSKARRAVLALLFGQPDRPFYTREIVAAAGTGASQIQKELDQLTRAGLLIRERRANQVYFRANPEAPIFPELKGLVAKTFGIADLVRAAIEPLQRRIRFAAIYGSVAKGEHHSGSDVDLLVVGTVRLSDLTLPLHAVEERLGRRISVTLLDLEEFRARIAKGDHFLGAVLKGPLIPLIGSSALLDSSSGRAAG